MNRKYQTPLYLLTALALVFALAILVASCGGSTTTTTAAPTGSTATTETTTAGATTTAPSATGPIVIGYSGPLTGNGASAGQDYLNGIKLYVDKLNAAGGINGQKVEIMAEDDVMDPKNSTTVAQKLVDAKVVAVLGPVTSGTAIPTLKIYGDANIPQLTPASNPDVTAQGVKSVFRVDPDDYAQGGNIGRYSYSSLGAKTAAVINDKQAFGQGVSEQFQKAFEAAGGKTTSVNGITTGDVDFRAVLTKIKSENPDMVYFGGVAAEGGLIAKQMRELGMQQKLFVPDQCFGPEFIKIGGSGAEGTYISYQGPPLDSTPELKAFTDEFKAKYGAEPFVGQFGYVSMQLVEAAIKSAGAATGQGITDALHANTYPTVLGDYKFEANGALGGGGTIYIYQVKAGKDAYVGESAAQ
ncbi:MAG: branched-chain amino acid ABC transporter substrate-binding protein [Actinobacteria bacterium]|nr:branched-chain amino acid ABC transporter substrate-binding protein [Actinomycetota bacterium]